MKGFPFGEPFLLTIGIWKGMNWLLGASWALTFNIRRSLVWILSVGCFTIEITLLGIFCS
jgi:hypothetical protein